MDYSLGLNVWVWKIISDSLFLLLLLPFIHALLLKKHKKEALSKVICGYVISSSLVLLLKYSLKVPRPQSRGLTDYGFPSMHSSLAFLSASYLSPILYIWSLLIAYSRLALGVHRLIDVVAGMIIGTSIYWVVNKYWNTAKKRISKNEIKKEYLRQGLHILVGLAIYFLAYLFPKPVAFLTLTFLLSFLMFLQNMENIKHTYTKIFPNNIIKKIYTRLSRKNEEKILLGPITLLLGSLIAIAFFPPYAYLPALLVLAISDGLATVVGKTIGSYPLPFNKNKTIEGAIAGGLSTFIIFAFLTSYIMWYKALIMSLLFIVLELLPLNKKYMLLEDNLFLPFVFSLVWWVLRFF